MKLKLALIAGLMAVAWLVVGTEHNIVKFGPSDALTDSGIVQPSTGNYEFGPGNWGTIIVRVPDNTVSAPNENGTGLMILAGRPVQDSAGADGADITLKASDGVGTNGYGGSISIQSGQAAGTGVPGIITLKAPTLFVNGNVVVFSQSASAPADTHHIDQWIAVQVAGDTNSYRLPLYK